MSGVVTGMLVRRGWASEYAKRKFDIELNSGEDLGRILAEAMPGASSELVGLVAARMTAGDIYRILDAEAMMFVHDTLAKFEPAAAEKHAASLRAARADRDTALARYLPKREPVPEPSEAPE